MKLDLRESKGDGQPTAVEVVVDSGFTGSVELHFKDGAFKAAKKVLMVHVEPHADLMRQG